MISCQPRKINAEEQHPGSARRAKTASEKKGSQRRKVTEEGVTEEEDDEGGLEKRARPENTDEKTSTQHVTITDPQAATPNQPC